MRQMKNDPLPQFPSQKAWLSWGSAHVLGPAVNIAGKGVADVAGQDTLVLERDHKLHVCRESPVCFLDHRAIPGVPRPLATLIHTVTKVCYESIALSTWERDDQLPWVESSLLSTVEKMG